MGRMYSRKKGKAGSKKPIIKKNPVWLRHQGKEVEMLIAKFAKEDKSASVIGMILRDSFGVPDVYTVCGKTITEVLAEKKLLHQIPEDLRSLFKRALEIQKHMLTNKQDMTAKRGLQLTMSKISRLVKYYKRVEKLPWDWKYDLESIKIYIN